jgi:CRP-like cAMP-binding protein
MTKTHPRPERIAFARNNLQNLCGSLRVPFATAAAAEYSEVVEIAKSDFDDYIDSSPAVIAAALKALVDRLRETTVRLKSPETMNIY